MPSASVTMTVKARPLTLARDRSAKRKSVRRLIEVPLRVRDSGLFLAGPSLRSGSPRCDPAGRWRDPDAYHNVEADPVRSTAGAVDLSRDYRFPIAQVVF